MILYFDTYITDIPLNPGVVSPIDDFRNIAEGTNYQRVNKKEIAKYSLASYAEYNWSDVLIRYKLDNLEDYKEFDEYIFSLFPNATVLHERSDNQLEYLRSVDIIDGMKGDFVFFTPNNDHPMVCNNLAIVDKLLSIGKSYLTRYDFISLYYSHFSEAINCVNSDLIMKIDWYKDVNKKILRDDEDVVEVMRDKLDYDSIQAMSKKLFKHMFSSKQFVDKRIIRLEDIGRLVDIGRLSDAEHENIAIIPKKEICAHFDGLLHTWSIGRVYAHQVPPLFMPPGFFKKTIRIAYGYDEYRSGWVNINPIKDKFIFEDKKKGTDLKILIEDLPLFWHKYIVQIDQNPKIDVLSLRSARDKFINIYRNPFVFSSRRLKENIMFVVYYVEFLFDRNFSKSNTYKYIKLLKKKFKFILKKNDTVRKFFKMLLRGV